MNIKKIFLLTLLVGIPLTLSSYQVNSKAAKTIYKNVDPNKEQTLPLGLKSHNEKKLAQFINQTVTPGNTNYRKYITPQQFGARYGLSSQRVKAVEQDLHKYHLKTYTYPGNIVMSVTGKTKDIEKAFDLKLKQTTNQKYNYQEAFNHGRVDKQIQNDVSYLDKTALEIVLKKPKQSQTSNKVITDEKNYDKRLLQKVNDPNVTNRSYQKFTKTYNANSLYQNFNGGQGQTIGILSTANFQMSDVEQYWKEYGVNNSASRIKKIFVDHVDSDVNRDETTMDVEQASALAPKANINVYIGNDSYDGGFVTLYAEAIGKDNVDVLANSFGNIESNYGKHSPMITEFKLLNLLSQQAAAQGITNLNAAGDTGPYSFYNNNKLGAGVPADSPYVTAVGGTTLPFKDVPYSVFSGSNLKYQFKNDKTISINHETAWSSISQRLLFGKDYLEQMKKEYDQYLLAAAKSPSAKERVQKQLKDANNQRLYNYQGGGGGFSNLFALPNYQKGISGVGTYNAKQFLNLKAGQMNWNAQLINGKQAGRNVPDISANADPLTGYSLYIDGYNQFLGGAGTSIATPQIAAMAALINQSKHQRMGFWNPQIYRFAKTSHSPFTPLNSLDNNNLYYVGQPGKLYNQATGLGTVDFTKLNQAFGK